MKQIIALPLFAVLALVLNSCACGGGCGGSGKVSLEDNCTRHLGSHFTAQGSTGVPHIGLVPTMETLAE